MSWFHLAALSWLVYWTGNNLCLVFSLAGRNSQVVQLVKTLPANSGDTRDTVSIPGLGRFPGGEHGNRCNILE